VDAEIAELEARTQLQEAEIQARSAELSERGRRIDELERVATRLSERVVEREGELRRLRGELARVSGAQDAQLATMTALLGELEDVRRTARGQATRIRLGALREAAELSERVAEMTSRPAGMRERILDALTEAIARIGGEEEPAQVEASSNGHGAVDAKDLFSGLIEVEIGPLSDFSQLVGFEDAAKSIGATADISVTRFSEGRATLELELAEPVELLRELEERCDLEFVIRDQRKDRVVLDVGN
jgi:hypothetical protein